MVAKENTFTAWELETIFHMAKNSAMKSESPFFEKMNALSSKALKQQAEVYPEYNHGIKRGSK
jgi:hypothetical protein